jgi:hypothetical protein
MMNHRFLGATLVIAAFTGSLIAAELKSGPQAGDNAPGPFHPLNVCNVDNPGQNGKKNCFV